MDNVRIWIGEHAFSASFEDRLAPRTCAAFRRLLPWRKQLIHVRWSGEACWAPLGDFDLDVGAENPTSRPSPGQVLFYPGGVSETELLIAYGEARFACRSGELFGNPLLSIGRDLERLRRLGRETLYRGATTITIAG